MSKIEYKEKEQQVMLETEAITLLKKYDITYPEFSLTQNNEEARLQAERIGYPVVLKVVSPQIIHKSDAGGVKTNLKSPKEVEKAYEEIIRAVKNYDSAAQVLGILVCRQAAEGQEVIIGALHDEIFGPTIMLGLGGIFVEVLGDVTFRACPVSRKEAEKMVREIKGFPLLSGFRGRACYDIEALADILTKVSNLLIDNPEIMELDLNPVRVFEIGAEVLDARVITQRKESSI